jgi:uncharacterized protein (DUF111 family)
MNGYETDTVTRLETNLDDLSPELTGSVMAKLFEAGALDVWFTPIQMKKNRPGVTLAVLCNETEEAQLADIIFSETTAFGLRTERVVRIKLRRVMTQVDTAFGVVAVKLGYKGEQLIQRAPEFESCREAAEKSGVAIRVVFAAASFAAAQL